MSLSIVRALQDKDILLTGATGFLGLALVEKLLRHVPGCRLTLLVRGASHAAAQQRFVALAAAEPLFAGIEATAFERVSCFAADITLPQLGLSAQDRERLQGRIALVIHSAASVDFDEPIDEAIDINIEGPLAVQTLASEIGAGFLQISTAYVCGSRSGAIPDTLDSAAVSGTDAAVELQQLRNVVESIYATHGYQRANGGRQGKRLIMDLMTAGRDHANARGWTDIYTYTKYLAERLLVQRHGVQPLGIFRPAIIESAAGGQYPGWLKGVKVMDAILAAYGKGMIPGFPADLDVPLDVIPVDMVASGVLAQAAQMLAEPHPADVNVCQLGTSASNPMLLRAVAEYVYAHYRANPLPDATGKPIMVRRPRVPLLKNHVLWLERYLALLKLVYDMCDTKLLTGMTGGLRRRVVARQKNVKRYLALAKMFSSYAQTQRLFDTRNADALYKRLNADERQLFNFAHQSIDWRSYMLDHHLPGLNRLLTATTKAV